MSIKEISEKVAADAREQVRFMEQKTEKDAALKIKEAQDEAGAVIERATVTGDRRAEHELKRTESRAVLAARDRLISTKRELIENAFSLARTSLDEMSESDYVELLSRLIYRHAAGGEQIIFDPEVSKTATKQAIERANALLRAANRQPVLAAPFTREMGRGLVIDSGRVEEDLSFNSLMRTASEELEADVTRTLFGDS